VGSAGVQRVAVQCVRQALRSCLQKSSNQEDVKGAGVGGGSRVKFAVNVQVYPNVRSLRDGHRDAALRGSAAEPTVVCCRADVGSS